MGMEIETQLSDQIARYLDLAAAEAKLTAANMANVDTPGYRTVGMDFEAEMREAMDDVERGRPAAEGACRPKSMDSWRAPTETTFPSTAKAFIWPRRN